MTTAADPTMTFLRDLEDPSLYHVVRNVPVFVPHKMLKRDADGNVREVEVTPADLDEIARHNNAREGRTGTLAVLTLGHRLQGKDVPETMQPPVVGYARNWRVGHFGPEKMLCLLYDEYVKQRDRDEAGEYPFRSADYYRGRKEISGVAKLKRDSELDLGMVVYAGGDALLCYSREVNDMADPNDPTTPPDAADADDGGVPPAPETDEREQYDRHCASHPYARGHHERQLQYAMEASGGPEPPAPGAGAPPPAPPEGVPPAQPEPFARKDAALTYARLDRENRELKGRLAALEGRAAASEKDARVTQYARELEQLQREGVELDVEDEMGADGGNCGAMTRRQFDRHKERIALKYERSPAGARPVPVARDVPGPSRFTARDLEAVEEYLRAHEGCAYEEAEEYARGKRTLLGTPVQG